MNLASPRLQHRGKSLPQVCAAIAAAYLFAKSAAAQAPPRAESGRQDWPVAGGDPAGTHFSPLAQIHTGNVHRLTTAWTYQSNDSRADDRSQIQCNPIIVGGVLYGTTPQLKLVALDARTGNELWRFDPFADNSDRNSIGVNRGVVWWKDGDDQRILFTAGQSLFAINARTGQRIATFGDNGAVDLRDGLGRDAGDLHVLSNSPGVIFENLLILGTRVSEGPGPSAPGHIRAYDVRSGRIAWVFHTIPHPGEFGHETWPPDAWKKFGGANAWSGITVDTKRGWVFLPTGSPAFDFWGGDRHGANLFGNCVLVLDARTGKRIWHFQTVHHDLWDRDLPAAPNLVTVRQNGREIDAVAQITKSGFVFLLNRETGVPLFPVVEVPVPPSDLRGELAWPSQPLPVKPKPFARQRFTEADVTNISPESRKVVLERLRNARTGHPFIPPSSAGTVILPGFDGGGEWGGAAVDPDRGILYVNSNEMPWILTMVEVAPSDAPLGERLFSLNCAACHGIDRAGDPQRTIPSLIGIAERVQPADVFQLLEQGRGVMPSFSFLAAPEKQALVDYLFGRTSETAVEPRARPRGSGNVPYTHTGYNRFLDPEGYPAIKPPWGTLNAINLNTGEFEWTVVLGEFNELTRRGIPPTGTENYGGPILTAGGLIFIGATKDEKFRAFDSATGRILWETQLPAGGYATPSTYMVDGKQYVVIAAGGGKMGTKSGDAYIAFALPDEAD